MECVVLKHMIQLDRAQGTLHDIFQNISHFSYQKNLSYLINPKKSIVVSLSLYVEHFVKSVWYFLFYARRKTIQFAQTSRDIIIYLSKTRQIDYCTRQ